LCQMMGAAVTCPVRGRTRPAAPGRILAIAMVLAVVGSATDTMGCSRQQRRCAKPWVTGPST
jgi:hypothetical protein